MFGVVSIRRTFTATVVASAVLAGGALMTGSGHSAADDEAEEQRAEVAALDRAAIRAYHDGWEQRFLLNKGDKDAYQHPWERQSREQEQDNCSPAD